MRAWAKWRKLIAQHSVPQEVIHDSKEFFQPDPDGAVLHDFLRDVVPRQNRFLMPQLIFQT
jgi:hypothetical protein